MKEFNDYLSAEELKIQSQVLAAAAKEGIEPWDSCVVGQSARRWPLMVLIEMNLQRIRKGFDPLPVRSEDGVEFYSPWSYAAVGVKTPKELATLFETIAERIEKRKDSEDDSFEDFDEEDFFDYEESSDEEEAEGDEFSGFKLEDIELDEDGNPVYMLEPLELNPNYNPHDKNEPEDEQGNGGLANLLKNFTELFEDDEEPEDDEESFSGQEDDEGLFEGDEDYCFDEGLDELTASAKADAELDRFNLILDAQLSWIRNYPDAEQRVEFYKWLREFLAEAADRLDELY